MSGVTYFGLFVYKIKKGQPSRPPITVIPEGSPQLWRLRLPLSTHNWGRKSTVAFDKNAMGGLLNFNIKKPLNKGIF
jgi:hypothetical protein